MKKQFKGNLLMVSNYPSDTAYAWWLMEHFWLTLEDIYSKEGFKIFLSYPKITSLSINIKNSDINAVELDFNLDSFRNIKNNIKFLRKHKISCLYLTDKKFFSPGYFLLRIFGVKNIVIHDHTPGDRPPVKGIKGILKALAHSINIFTADLFLCVSELMRQRNLNNNRIVSKKCKVVQNGIKPVKCIKNNKIQVRNSLGLNDGDFLVATTGRAHPYKRFDFIIECAKHIKSTYPESNCIFILVGDGPFMHDLKQMVHDYNLSDSVLLLGFRNDIYDLLCASDIAMHAALGEGFSLSIIEYMSSSLPVLVPDIPSVCQAINHEDNGFIYPWDDVKAASEYILRLEKNQELREHMGKSSKIIADSTYSLERCTNEFRSIYSD